MTLDEAIQHAEEVAMSGCTECHNEHGQLAEWLKDYKEMKLCDTEAVTRNLSAVSDRFFCEKCRIYLENWMKCLYYEDTEDTKYQEYEFKFCPECGRRVMEE